MQMSDCVDIIIVSLFLFLGLKVLQRNVHRRVLGVFAFVALLFWGARTYHWQLTYQFIQVLAAAAGIGFFLVFQEDFRRFFESYIFSTVSLKKKEKDFDLLSKTLVKAITTFSKNQIGALIVLQQRIPVSNMVRGGHRLNGEVSLPLLCSIFDPHSLGHDGAVIIDGTRVTRFGVHLPLSRNIEATGRSGTRHSAALGLSELCDAFILVVSEESGEVSIASQGQFWRVTPEQLEQRLLILKMSDPEIPFNKKVSRYFKQHWYMQALCATGAFMLWLGFAAPRNLQQRTFILPVTLEDIPRGQMIDDPLPADCKVTLTGSEDSFVRWQKEKQFIRLPVSSLKPGNHRLALSPTNLSLPAGLFLRQFEPALVTVQVHGSRMVEVPVVVNMQGRTLATTASKARVVPEKIKVLVREKDPGPSMILTESPNPNKMSKGDVQELKLIPPAKTQFFDQNPGTVKVAFD